MAKRTASEVLLKYIPENTVPPCIKWINEYRLHLTIKKTRTTKLGDFRPAFDGKPARISVNGDLNKYAFLITLVHEIAHGVCWIKHQQKVQPHGKEWKNIYTTMLSHFIGNDTFPKELEQNIIAHINNPKASSCSDIELLKALRSHDDDPITVLEELPIETIFELSTGRRFIKKEQKRKRFLCLEISSNKMYLVSPMAEVKRID
jgi:hypothetical protein